MTTKRILASLLLILINLGSATISAQDANVREVFRVSHPPADGLKQAPITETPPTPPTTKRTKAKRKSHSADAPSKHKLQDSPEIHQAAALPEDYVGIGLGYTLLLDNGSSDLSTVSPARIFQTGQAVRLLLESNIDGYLYIFHQEGDGPPKMLFPNWRDNEGNNYIRAHRPVLIPAENRITFVGSPAVETLTLVVSRDPVAGLPLRDALRGLRRIDVPLPLFRQVSQPCVCQEDRDDIEGSRNTTLRGGRDIELTKADPLPSHVYMNRNQSARKVTARIRLVHK